MKLIEFLGMPRAGKTTQILRLKSALERKGYRVGVVTDRERAERIHVRPIESLAYILVFFSHAIEEYFSFLPDHDYLLMDRGFNDAAVWADVRLAFHQLTDTECAAFKACFARFMELVDASFYFDLPVEIALQRHVISGEHQDVDKTAMNQQWLETIRRCYQKNEKAFHRPVRIDGRRSVEEIEKEIQEALGRAP